jgi:hypothetical protein
MCDSFEFEEITLREPSLPLEKTHDLPLECEFSHLQQFRQKGRQKIKRLGRTLDDWERKGMIFLRLEQWGVTQTLPGQGTVNLPLSIPYS